MSSLLSTIEQLVLLLHQHQYSTVKQRVDDYIESKDSDSELPPELRLIRLVSTLKSSPSEVDTASIADSLTWSYSHPQQVCCEIAFIALLSGDARRSLELLDSWPYATRTGTYLSRVGTANLLVGNFSDALNAYREAIDYEPEIADHFNNLGGALARLQRLDEALEAYRECLSRNPSHPQASRSIVLVAAQLDVGDDFLQELEERAKERPDCIETRLSLFNTLVRFGSDDEAVKLLVESLVDFKSIPKITKSEAATSHLHIAQLNYRLALVSYYSERKRLKNALALTNQCIALTKDAPSYLILLRVEILGDLGYYKEASSLLENPEDFEVPDQAILAQSNLLSKQGREVEALKLLEKITRESPVYQQGLHQKAALLLSIGKIDECQSYLLEIAESNVLAFAQLVQTKNYTASDEVIEKLVLVASNPLLSKAVLESACFALSECYAKRGDYPISFYYLEKANRMVASDVKYNPDAFTRRVNLNIQCFGDLDLSCIERLPKSRPQPIFIVGMPRSGTTLTETILGSHPQVYPCGELAAIPSIANAIRRNFPHHRPYPRCIRDIGKDELVAMANAYIRELPRESREKFFASDKLPHNFMYVGLIHLLFPDSPIIHVMRDPRDTGLSNFQQNFGAKHGGMGYAFDMGAIAKQINDYHRMMHHWRALKIPMLEFWYEDLVKDQEEMTHRILDYCGLPWSDSVMSFYNLERSVRTASVGQVRKKIYHTSSQKWRRYEQELQPMIKHFDRSWVRYYEEG